MDFEVVKANRTQISAICRIADDSDLSLWKEEDYSRECGRNDSIFLTAIDGSVKVIGFIDGRIVSDDTDDGSFCEIYNLAVAGYARRNGIASKLFEVFAGEMRSRGVRNVFLEVRSKNVAGKNFYAARGFEQCGLRKHFYSDPEDDAIIMKSAL